RFDHPPTAGARLLCAHSESATCQPDLPGQPAVGPAGRDTSIRRYLGERHASSRMDRGNCRRRGCDDRLWLPWVFAEFQTAGGIGRDQEIRAGTHQAVATLLRLVLDSCISGAGMAALPVPDATPDPCK